MTDQSWQYSKYVPKKDTEFQIPRWVTVIFKRFALIYGPNWAGEDENVIRLKQKEWASTESLKDLNDELVIKIINKCKEEFEYAPSIAKFVKIKKEIVDANKIKSTSDRPLDEHRLNFFRKYGYWPDQENVDYDKYKKWFKANYGRDLPEISKDLVNECKHNLKAMLAKIGKWHAK
jgi:hypothetical protein